MNRVSLIVSSNEASFFTSCRMDIGEKIQFPLNTIHLLQNKLDCMYLWMILDIWVFPYAVKILTQGIHFMITTHHPIWIQHGNEDKNEFA